MSVASMTRTQAAVRLRAALQRQEHLMLVIYLKSAYEGKNQMTFIDVDSSGEDCQNLGVTELVFLCARDTGNERIWAEFLRRFAPVIRFFVWRTLRNLRHGSLISRESLILGI